jgi:hypothetical protein
VELIDSLTGSKNGADRISLIEYLKQIYFSFIPIKNEIDEQADFPFRI